MSTTGSSWVRSSMREIEKLKMIVKSITSSRPRWYSSRCVHFILYTRKKHNSLRIFPSTVTSHSFQSCFMDPKTKGSVLKFRYSVLHCRSIVAIFLFPDSQYIVQFSHAFHCVSGPRTPSGSRLENRGYLVCMLQYCLPISTCCK